MNYSVILGVAIGGTLLGVGVVLVAAFGDRWSRKASPTRGAERADDLDAAAERVRERAAAASDKHAAQDADDASDAREAVERARADGSEGDGPSARGQGGLRTRSKYAGELGVGEDDP